jgi:Flp pilus assembly protein TadD
MDARGRGDTVTALPALERAVAMAPSDRSVRFEYGQLLYSMRRYAAAVRVLAPLAQNGDAQSEPGFVALYLDAVGRAGGASAVIHAATPLARSAASAATASLYLGVANEQLGRITEAESAYAHGLRSSPGDSILRARHAALERSTGRAH